MTLYLAPPHEQSCPEHRLVSADPVHASDVFVVWPWAVCVHTMHVGRFSVLSQEIKILHLCIIYIKLKHLKQNSFSFCFFSALDKAAFFLLLPLISLVFFLCILSHNPRNGSKESHLYMYKFTHTQNRLCIHTCIIARAHTRTRTQLHKPMHTSTRLFRLLFGNFWRTKDLESGSETAKKIKNKKNNNTLINSSTLSSIFFKKSHT